VDFGALGGGLEDGLQCVWGGGLQSCVAAFLAWGWKWWIGAQRDLTEA